MALLTRLLALRSSPVLFRLPPYLSALCVVIGVAWLFILPLDQYSRQTYVSENAILPGQVHTYFGGSEHNVFRAYRQEAWALSQQPEHLLFAGLSKILSEIGLKVANQSYSFNVAGESISGQSVYGLLQGPRADATEAIVLIAAWKNFDGEINYSGVALALTLARYFKRWSIWSKDVIVLVPADSVYGPEAWVSAYHSPSLPGTPFRNVSSLPIRAGALQAAVALDYPVGPWGHRFEKLDVLYDGINGALPNLDLLNTAISIASGQMGIGCCLHGMKDHSDNYKDRFLTLAKGVMTQAAGHATGPHSAFIPYHVDAITLKTVGDGWHDEMSLGRTTESLFRSINNLLEHLHQSFFLYILLNANRFASVGNYLPAAMLVAVSFTITALASWVQSGRTEKKPSDKKLVAASTNHQAVAMEMVKEGSAVALIPKVEMEIVERKLFVPAVVVLAVHFISLLPLYTLNYLNQEAMLVAFRIVTAASAAVPFLVPVFTGSILKMSRQQILLIQSFSLLIFGAALSTLATLNFSLAFVIGVMASPLALLKPDMMPKSLGVTSKSFLVEARRLNKEGGGRRSARPESFIEKFIPGTDRTSLMHYGAQCIFIVLRVVGQVMVALLSPPILLSGLSRYLGKDVDWVLREMAKGWVAQGAWTSFVVWCLWWPAWLLGSIVCLSHVEEKHST